MFSKSQRNSDGTMQERPRSSNGAVSIVGSDTSIEGAISTQGDVHVEGKVIGDIKAYAVQISDNAEVEGAVECESLDIRGQVKGDVRCKMVVLHAQSHVEGTIRYGEISVESGAFINGEFHQIGKQGDEKRPAKPVSAVSAPAKENSSNSSASSSSSSSGSGDSSRVASSPVRRVS